MKSCLSLVAVLLTLPPATAEGFAARAAASGDAMRVIGANPVDMNATIPARGSIRVETTEKGNRWSHVQNTDVMRVEAEWSDARGYYQVSVTQPMPRHPMGRYTTWNGVVYHHEMHGETGIGTGKLPKMRPDIALWGYARVTLNGRELARLAPAHVMVMKQGPMPGIMLEVATEDKDLVGEPEGYLTVMWHSLDTLTMPTGAERFRAVVGWLGLGGLTALFWILAAAESRPSHQQELRRPGS